jgi:transcriptional regulator with XRE-family HTH domain
MELDVELTQAFDWKSALRRQRKLRKWTLKQLADRTGVSLAALKSYETGRRRPSERVLRSLIATLGIPREEANPLLAGAGYAVDWNAIFHERFAVPSIDEQQAELDSLPWPAFVTNQSFDVLRWNRPLEALFEVDPGQRDGFLERNLLAGITDDSFARRLLNWDEVVAFMIGLAKGDPRAIHEPEAPAPWLEPAVARLMSGHPARIRRLLQLWEIAPPIKHTLRHRYRVSWDLGNRAALSFACSFVPADLWNELHWNEWIPANAETWNWIETLQPHEPRKSGVESASAG